MKFYVSILRNMHWLSLCITDCAIALRCTPLFNLGGAIECWADERIEQALWVVGEETEEQAS